MVSYQKAPDKHIYIIIYMKYLYKSLPEDRQPNGFKFKLGKWYKHEGELEICKAGFHASKNFIDVFGFVIPYWVAKVAVRGKSIIQNDKECWEEMKIVKWVKWTKKDSVSLAVFAAELVLNIYENKYPNDLRPRQAIEAAKKVLKHDTKKNRDAARYAAWAAWAAWGARDAAWAARYAARAARDAARDAAWDAAGYVAGYAAGDKILTKCHNFILKRKGL